MLNNSISTHRRNQRRRNQKKSVCITGQCTITVICVLLCLLLLITVDQPASLANDEPVYSFGWTPPPQEIEDELIQQGMAGVEIVPNLPYSWSLRNSMEHYSPVRNQQERPTCVGFAITSMLEYVYGKQYAEPIELSPGFLFCKCNCGCQEGNPACTLRQCNEGEKPPCNPDSGIPIYCAIETAMVKGVPRESCYPYSQQDLCCQNKTCSQSETYRSFIKSCTFIDSNPLFPQKIDAMKSCLYKGYVFTAGIPIFSNYHYTADIPNPSLLVDEVIDRHALCFTGYQDDPAWLGGGFFWFKNSWGPDWGDNGYGRISYAYMQALAREIVVVTEIGPSYQHPCLNNHPPEITEWVIEGLVSESNIFQGCVDRELHFTLSAEDVDADDTLTYSLTYLLQNSPAENSPAEVEHHIDIKNGESHWTPEKEGAYEFTFTVTDVCGSSDSKTIPIEVSCCKKGDLNGDGQITPSDALVAFKCYLGTGPCHACFDVNKDNGITPSDALCIFQNYLGLPSCLN